MQLQPIAKPNLDPVIRRDRTISTAEMIQWIKDIPALKQVMIIDACGAGAAVDNLLASRDIDGSQIKAIDRMQDRTGMFVISGCAADAVSYEASEYGQGLLTYTILEAISGPALREGEFVDVLRIMEHSRERVPQLAEGIGGIQNPQILVPRNGSFDLGKLSKEDQLLIPLAQPKSIFVQSNLVDKHEYADHRGLSDLVDQAIRDSSGRSNTSIIYFDVKSYKDACKVTGPYYISNGVWFAEIKVRCGSTVSRFDVRAPTSEELVQEIIKKL